MQLYFSPFSPYVRKCLVTAHELGLADRIRLLPSSVHPVQRDRTVIERNPLGKIPTLITDEGRVLYDSRVVCEYLDDLAGGGRLFPRSGDARWTALTLQSLADGVLDAALLVRYEATARPEALRWKDWSDGQMDKIHTGLASLDQSPAQLEGRVDIGTIALGCAVGYLDIRFADWGWRERYPALARWEAAFAQRPSMQARWSL